MVQLQPSDVDRWQSAENELERVHDKSISYLGRYITIEVYYDYNTAKRTVRAAVATSRNSWKFRHQYDHCMNEILFTREHTESGDSREMDRQVLEVIAAVKDEQDAAERACSKTTWDAMESIIDIEIEDVGATSD